jgi:hypothetical protein
VEFEVDAIVASKVERGRKLYRVRWVRRRRVFRFSFFRGGDREGKKAARREKCLTHSHPLSLPENKNSPLQAGYKPKDDTWEPEVWIGGSRAREEERERERERERREERQGEKTHFRLFFFPPSKHKNKNRPTSRTTFCLQPGSRSTKRRRSRESGERRAVAGGEGGAGVESRERDFEQKRESETALCVSKKGRKSSNRAFFFFREAFLTSSHERASFSLFL